MKSFPVLESGPQKLRLPWDFVEQYRARLESNHDQTLERLAERGGLAWSELACGVENRPLGHIMFARLEADPIKYMKPVLVALHAWESQATQATPTKPPPFTAISAADLTALMKAPSATMRAELHAQVKEAEQHLRCSKATHTRCFWAGIDDLRNILAKVDSWLSHPPNREPPK